MRLALRSWPRWCSRSRWQRLRGSASELLQDPNATLLSLKANAKGEAAPHATVGANGQLRHVLVWGAI